jgi:hypothetical protein
VYHASEARRQAARAEAAGFAERRGVCGGLVEAEAVGRESGDNRSMDLTKTTPRSAKEQMLGLYSLARTIDKARAYNEGTLGEYDYDCPHDKPLFAFLGTNGAEFAAKVKELGSDDNILDWVQREFVSKKTPAEIAAFNDDRLHWHPSPGDHSYDYFVQARDQIAPGRSDVVTWFDLLDLDEKRPVPQPTAI